MIRLHATKDKANDKYQPQTYFNCPLCDARNSFFSVAPARCHGCMKPLPVDVRKLMDNEDYRLSFHTDGRITIIDYGME